IKPLLGQKGKDIVYKIPNVIAHGKIKKSRLGINIFHNNIKVGLSRMKKTEHKRDDIFVVTSFEIVPTGQYKIV
ncbi:MAG: hypothetical protein IJU37_06375, partial [Desulfovibrio sp.]|nr:hypothetical protein [Desulfovibrio sp.]